LRRETATTALSYHDFLYEVERIEKTASGACIFDLTHFPIDNQGRSLVALEVAAATAPGFTISPGRSDYSCDENSSSDNTGLGGGGIDYPASGGNFDPPTEAETTVNLPSPTESTWPTGGYPPTGPNVSQPAGEPTGGQTPVGGWDNPVDPLEDDSPLNAITGASGPGDTPIVGDTLSVSASVVSCVGRVCWSKINKDTGEEFDISCQDETIEGSYSISVTSSEIDYTIVAVAFCKDPAAPGGFGSARVLGETKPVPTYAQYNWQLLDQTGAGPVVSSIRKPSLTAPYACFLSSVNPPRTTCLIDVQTENCNFVTVATSYFATAPTGDTPTFTINAPVKTADCP
jgi:hypothetical protein